MNQPLLLEHFPTLAQHIPWISLGCFPTPVARLKNTEKRLDVKSLWVKREGLSGEIYGGNKVRTLEFSLADAIAQKAERVIAYSALGSHWPLACTVYAKVQGLAAEVYFLPYPMDEIKEKNLAVTRRLADRVVTAKSLFTFPLLLYFNLRKSRKLYRTYLMPPGGTSATTTLGHVNAVFELQSQQAQGAFPIPDLVFCPLGSRGTAAGLAIGFRLINWPTQVMAVRVVDYVVANKWTLQGLIRSNLRVLRKNGVAAPARSDNVRIWHAYFGKGYGIPTAQAKSCLHLLKTEEGLGLDLTYTGKTFAAIFDLSEKGLLHDKNVLFWQTLNSRSIEDIPKNLQLNKTH